ncbi:9851_t:CDS:2 [Funneliformis caledonium]|uniref:9851_t:CDS:1 n=1 Tax=Funneliformis caledonium TaxID=1117310 RepID=A0A9N8YPS9_9GLOM|nr:9851_t:CDS:2 [Funneliformis caledonium]
MDANAGAESLSQVITERNQLRSQNDQLWKLIEKQKSVIDNLQKENQKLSNERERLIIKLRDNDSINSSRSEDEKTPIEKGGSEDKKPVESDNSSNSNNINDIIVTAAPSTFKPPVQSVRQLPTGSVNSSQSNQPSPPQLSSLDKAPSLETKSLNQHDSSISASSDVSTNVETSVSAYDETDMKVALKDDEASSIDQQKEETHQLQTDTNSVKNENGIITHINESISSITIDSNDTSNLVKTLYSLPPVLPPKSIQRQHSLQIDNRPKSPSNLTEVQDSQDSPRNSQGQPTSLPIEQNSESSVLRNPPSPTISVKSSGSESVGSSGGTSRYTHNSTAQTIDTDLDENDALDQFPQPMPREKSNFEENHSVDRLDSEESISALTENDHKIPESPGLSNSSSSIPPRSPKLPSSPRAFAYGNESRKSSNDSELPIPPHSPSHDSKPNISNGTIIIDQNNASNDGYLQNLQGTIQIPTIEHNLPIRSQSLPFRDNNNTSQPFVSVPSDDSEDSSKKSRRDSLTHNHSDSNLGSTYLATDNVPKEKALRPSKSFNYISPVSPGPRARVSAMPPPRGGHYPELRNPGLNSNTLSIPGQNTRHSVYMTPGQSPRDSPAAERVAQHIKNKRSLPDAGIVTNPSHGLHQQSPQTQQQQMTQKQMSQQPFQQPGFTQQHQKPHGTQAITSDGISGIAVKVIGSNKKNNDKGKEVLAFVISVGHARVQDSSVVGLDKELWRVEKLYSDFLTLDSKLKQHQNKSTINKIGKLPDKNLFHNNAPSKVDQRKIALEQYLQHVISLPLKDSKDLCEFLSSNVIDQQEKDYRQSGYKEGYLTKKGKNFGGWKSRYFVLNNPVLDYYESKGGNHLGSIRLTYAQIGRQQNNNINEADKDSDNSFRHAFLILEPKTGSKNKHVLCAESDAERDEWVEALLQYVGFGKHEFFDAKLLANEQQRDNRPDRKKGNDSISSFSSQSDQWNDPPRNSLGGNQQQSMLGVSSTPVVKRGSVLSRDDPDRRNYSGTPDRENTASPVGGTSVNNPPQQSSYVQGVRDQMQLHGHLRRPHDDSNQVERKKTSRKTFFGSMFGSSKDDKKKSHESRPDVSKIVFGVPLDYAISVARIKEGYELPAVVYRCIEYLDANNATEEEGIYRLNGATATIKFLKERFNSEGDVDLIGEGEYYDVHAVAGLLKLYLRELPTSVLTRELHAEFVNVIDLLDRRDRINELGRLVCALPLSNYTLLRTLTGHLIRIVQNSDINKMTVRNIGIVFSPTLGIPAGVFSLFMAEFDYIFFTDSNGTAAPRTIDAPPSENKESEESNSRIEENNKSVETSQSTTNNDLDVAPLSPSVLSPKNVLRRRDLREDIDGRSNRNSMHYMDGAPKKVVGLERKLTGTKKLRRVDSSDEEEVNDLALQADDDESLSSDSADESTSPINSSIRSAPVSPRLPTPNGLPRPNSTSSVHVESTEDTVSDADSVETRNSRRLTVRSFNKRDSMYEILSDAQSSQNEESNQQNNPNANGDITNIANESKKNDDL